jgi:hypothetical protein
MSEMVERVAKAIAGTRGRDPEDLEGGPHPSGLWLDKGESWWRGDIEAARAAIEVMREPTDEQRNEFFRLKQAAGYKVLGACFVDADWEMAIDAALKD